MLLLKWPELVLRIDTFLEGAVPREELVMMPWPVIRVLLM